MISMVGRGLVLGSLFFATLGFFAGAAAAMRKDRRAWIVTRNSAYGFAATMIAANLLMIYALLVKDFSVEYVTEVGSLATPWQIAIPSLWSSLNGSILFWGGILGGYVALTVWTLGEKHKEYAPWALHVLMGIAIFFAILVGGIANPFAPVAMVPPDGPGPNPLLQNHWLMIVHPPTLYLGYVGMSVPFSLVCASLLAGRLDAGWMVPVRRLMLVPWTFLTFGIMLGGWWSYEVLGWGGAWAWDPVENASFHPWLTGTAFLHSAMVLQRRGRMRDWTLVLGMATFLLTLLGTFMTRSGVFNSVHSFTQSAIGPVFLVFIAITLVYSVVLLAMRSHLLDESAKSVDGELGGRSDRTGGGFLTREFSILVQNLLFTVFTFTVLLGTLYPLITEAMQERKVSVGGPYFDKWALPLGLGIVFMMGVGPALPWGRTEPGAFTRRIAPAAVVGALFAGWAYAVGFDKPYTVLTLFTIGFALWCNLYEFVDPVRQRMAARGEGLLQATSRVFERSRRRVGGQVAHYGVLFAVFALALSKGYRLERDYTLDVGQAVQDFAGFTITYAGSELVTEPNRQTVVANFDVTRGGRAVGRFGPKMRYYPTQREPIVTPEVFSTPTYDLYFSLIEVSREKDATVVVRMIHEPYQMWLWWSAPIIALGSILALWPQRSREGRAAPAPVPAGVQPGGAK